MKKGFALMAVAPLFGVVGLSAQAETSINGFASVKAGVATSKDRALYGYQNEFNVKNESLLALQVRSSLGDKLSVTAQLMGRGSEDFNANFEWAFITYMLTDNTRLNLGRLRTPFYRYSDFMDVGYAYDWTRVPQGFYGLGFDNIEGVSLYHTGLFFGADSTWQVIYGSYNDDITLSGFPASAKATDIAGGSWELELGSFSYRLAYLRGDLTITSPMLEPLFAMLDQSGLSALTAALDFNKDTGNFIGLGVTYDNGQWIVISEYNQIDVKKAFFSKRENAYVSVGYRLDQLVPFVLVEKENYQAKSSIYQPYQGVLPEQVLMPVRELVQSQRVDALSYSLGLRYDFHPSAALKMQFTTRDDRLEGEKTSLLSFGVDLVF